MTEALLKDIRDLLEEIKTLLKNRPLYNRSIDSVVDQQDGKLGQQSWEYYLENKNPQNDYEIIALVVERLARNGKQAVTKEDIMEFIRDNPEGIKNTEAEKVSGSIDNAKNNSAYRYIEFADKNEKTYRLSIKGKQLVKRLPNREKESRKHAKTK